MNFQDRTCRCIDPVVRLTSTKLVLFLCEKVGPSSRSFSTNRPFLDTKSFDSLSFLVLQEVRLCAPRCVLGIGIQTDQHAPILELVDDKLQVLNVVGYIAVRMKVGRNDIERQTLVISASWR